MSKPDDVYAIGEIFCNAVRPIKSDGISLCVSAACYDYADNPTDVVLLEVSGGTNGFEFILCADRAEALGRILLRAAKDTRRHAEIRKETDESHDAL